jgi:hypothetical protein
MKFILCEPQCWGFEHALFNAALLDTILWAYPQAQVYFLGEREHLKWIRQSLHKAGVSRSNQHAQVTWQEIAIPAPDFDHWGRFTLDGYRQESAWLQRVLSLVEQIQADLLVITSITNPGLVALKRTIYTAQKRIPTIIIPHSILATIQDKSLLRLLKNRFSGFRQALHLPQPPELRYIALGGSILQYLQATEPRMAKFFRVLDPPYLWDQFELPQGICQIPQTVRYGYLGVGHKGFDTFARLATAVLSAADNVEFTLVGFLNTPKDPALYTGRVTGIVHEPLSTEEYARRANSLTYSVWVADHLERYRLAASVTFQDALSFIKPGIYLRNPYIEYYMSQMGDIGYLCDSIEQMRDLLIELVHNFPLERYQQQCQNILHARQRFDPQNLALQFRQITSEFRL